MNNKYATYKKYAYKSSCIRSGSGARRFTHSIHMPAKQPLRYGYG